MRHDLDDDGWPLVSNSAAIIVYIALAFLIVVGAWLFTALFILVGTPT